MTRTLQRWVPLGALSVCYLAGFGGLYVLKPPNPDQGIFDYIGWVGSLGGRYYVDVAEQNFPGEMMLHELAIRCFGANYWAYRALDFIILLGGAAALGGLLKIAGFGVGAVIGAACYLAGYVSSNAWMAGQRDVVAANLLLVIGLLWVCRLRGHGRLGLVAMGPLILLSLLLRPTYLLYVVAMPLVDWFSKHRTLRPTRTVIVDAAIVMLGIATCTLALVGWGLIVGSWPAFREQALLFNIQAYAAGHSRTDTLMKLAQALVPLLLFLPASAVSVMHAVRRERLDTALLMLLGLGLLALLSALVQNKGFGYHLGALLPPLFGLSGVASWIWMDGILRRPTRSVRVETLIGVAVALSLLGFLRQVKSLGPQLRYALGMESLTRMMAREGGGLSGFNWADMLAASEYVRSTTRPDQTILVWGRPVSIHLLSQRRSPTRFITYGMLVLAKAPFERAEEWNHEFEDALVRRTPQIVFLPTVGEQLQFGGFGPDEQNNAAIIALRHAIAGRYERERTFGSLAAFRLRE